MEGTTLLSEHHAALAMVSLDFGTFQEVYSDWFPDRFAYANLISAVEQAARRCEYSITSYMPSRLVAWDDKWLVWRPDQAYNNDGDFYRKGRYFAVKSVGILTAVDPKTGVIYSSNKAAIACWKTGHGRKSRFIKSVLAVTAYTACYDDSYAALIKDGAASVEDAVSAGYGIKCQNT